CAERRRSISGAGEGRRYFTDAQAWRHCRCTPEIPETFCCFSCWRTARPSKAVTPPSGESRISWRTGGTMKASIKIAMLVTLTVCGTIAIEAQEPTAGQSTPAAGAAATDDNMTPYRNLAADTLTAFKAHDMATAKKKARELEVAWDTREKTLQKRSPELWG